MNVFFAFFILLFISTSSSASEWKYYDSVKKMTGEKGEILVADSDNSINWMGYDHELYFMISEFENSDKKVYVFFYNKENNSYAFCNPCNALIRVGEDQPFSIPLIENTDNPSGFFETIISEEKLSKITRAKKFLVQIPIIGKGKPIMEFNIKNPT